jgi:predicted aspartyl protease
MNDIFKRFKIHQVLLLTIPFFWVIFSTVVHATDETTSIPLYDKGAVTFYVSGKISGFGETEFLVDTGSSYVAINKNTIEILKQQGKAKYIKNLTGNMADGSSYKVPLYRISSIRIGNHCIIQNVDAAILPGDTRNILGLSALKKAAPFTVSLNPPRLDLSNCIIESI